MLLDSSNCRVKTNFKRIQEGPTSLLVWSTDLVLSGSEAAVPDSAKLVQDTHENYVKENATKVQMCKDIHEYLLLGCNSAVSTAGTLLQVSMSCRMQSF